MATYVPSLKGYITDVAEVWLKRKDNKVFHFDQLSRSSVTPNAQFTEVNAGWSLYPVAYLPGQSTMEFTLESAQFDADLFALASNTEFKDETIQVWGNAVVEAETDAQTEYVIESDKSLTGATFFINGYKVTTGVEGKLVEAIGAAAGGAGAGATATVSEANKADVHTAAGFDVDPSTQDASTGVYKTRIILADATGIKTGDQVSISWYTEETHSTILVDNQQTFVGEAILRWPVYSSGEEIKAAGVKGYAVMHKMNVPHGCEAMCKTLLNGGTLKLAA